MIDEIKYLEKKGRSTVIVEEKLRIYVVNDGKVSWEFWKILDIYFYNIT